MEKIKILAILLIALAFASCAGLGGSAETNEYAFPHSGDFQSNANLPVKDFETKGFVFVTATETYDANDNHTGSKVTHEMIMREAEKLGADDVINIRTDVKRQEVIQRSGQRTTTSITLTYTAVGLAIKYTTAIIPASNTN